MKTNRFFTKITIYVLPILGLLIFQADDEVNGNKIIYLVLMVVLSCISLIKLSNSKSKAENRVISATAALLVFLAISIFTFQGEILLAIRNMMPIILIVLVIPIAIWLGNSLSPNEVRNALLIVSTLASLFFVTVWLGRRGALVVETGQLGLASITLPTLGLVTAFVFATRNRGAARLPYVILFIGTLGGLFLTGTRTNFIVILGAIPTLISRLTRKLHSQQLRPRLAWVIPAIAIFYFAFLFLLDTFDPAGVIQYRLTEMVSRTIANPESDLSFQIRAYQYSLGKDLFLSSPLIGIGFANHVLIQIYDTPFWLFSGLGVIGVFLLLRIINAVRTFGDKLPEDGVVKNIVNGWLFVMMALMIFGSPPQDKGFALSLLFIVSLKVAIAHEGQRIENRESAGVV